MPKDNNLEVATGNIEAMAPRQIFELGKKMRKSGNVELAIDFFSMALEKKIESLPKDEDMHPELAEFYTWYGDSLLLLEEKKSDVLNPVEKWQKKSQESNDHPDRKEGQQEISEEQLAFELLEMARLCYENAFGITEDILNVEVQPSHPQNEKLKRNIKEAGKQQILDYSFVHIRLGDIQLANEQSLEAARDYQRARLLREWNSKIGLEYEVQPAISESQAILATGDTENALKKYSIVLIMLKKIVDGHVPLASGVTLEDIKRTAEDVELQVEELRKVIDNGQLNSRIGLQTQTKFSSSAFGSEVSTTKLLTKPNLAQYVQTSDTENEDFLAAFRDIPKTNR